MMSKEENFYFLPFVILLLFVSLGFQRTSAEKKPYVVYLGEHSHNRDQISTLTNEKVTATHVDFLGSILDSKEKAKDAIFYSYTNVINGFAANLEEDEAMEVSKLSGVVSVFPSRRYKLHTTHSWEFMGLEKKGEVSKQSLWAKAKYGEDMIIGNLDTGVWPESESFNDDGMGPIPSRWKGACKDDTNQHFPCNRKLIGARYYSKGYQSMVGALNSSYNTPRDKEGHGTHTLSTAGGSFVPGASIYGYGNGTAKGGSPKARVAAYKVCWPPVNDTECVDTDILAGFDAAIHDGVDVLSVSLGGNPVDYFEDGLSIGAFHAVKKGITVVCSAGNSGPKQATVSNTAPWILTVGASTMDREFDAYLSYGNKKKHIKGKSLSRPSLPHDKFLPMVSSEDLTAANSSTADSRLCMLGSLDPEKTKGKIVVCLRGMNGRIEKGIAVLQAGGSGMVLANSKITGDEIISDWHVLPAIHISYSDGLKVYSYLNSTKSAYGHITKPETNIGVKPAPSMADFSSLGPNSVNPEILKPDITAPGKNIIASWTKDKSGQNSKTDGASFKLESGTSMSCPHISGVVALLKSAHPDWTPAAIRSAIMTSAHVKDNTGKHIMNFTLTGKATPFGYGAGHVSPNRAMSPGLIYDLTTKDYLNFLCARKYNATQIKEFSVDPYVCPSKRISIENMNYPSISVPNLSGLTTVTRMVRNVGGSGTYKARVESPKGVRVTVKPSKLEFTKLGEEKQFQVTFKSIKHGPKDYVFGALIWDDGKHVVRSPIVVKGSSQ